MWLVATEQGDVLLPFFFNFALVCGIRRTQESQEGLKLNETRQLDAYTNVSLLDKNINTDYKERHRIFISHQ
jgi:hypothetical protein